MRPSPRPGSFRVCLTIPLNVSLNIILEHILEPRQRKNDPEKKMNRMDNLAGKLSVAKLIIACSLALSPPAMTALPLAVDGEPLPSLAPMLEKIQGAVVNLSTTTRLQTRQNPLMQDPFFRRFLNFPERPPAIQQGLGSGVIVDAEKGYIITNHHLIDGADEITVTTSDGRSLGNGAGRLGCRERHRLD